MQDRKVAILEGFWGIRLAQGRFSWQGCAATCKLALAASYAPRLLTGHGPQRPCRWNQVATVTFGCAGSGRRQPEMQKWLQALPPGAGEAPGHLQESASAYLRQPQFRNEQCLM